MAKLSLVKGVLWFTIRQQEKAYNDTLSIGTDETDELIIKQLKNNHKI